AAPQSGQATAWPAKVSSSSKAAPQEQDSDRGMNRARSVGSETSSRKDRKGRKEFPCFASFAIFARGFPPYFYSSDRPRGSVSPAWLACSSVPPDRLSATPPAMRTRVGRCITQEAKVRKRNARHSHQGRYRCGTQKCISS